jgi:hypothetical protein
VRKVWTAPLTADSLGPPAAAPYPSMLPSPELSSAAALSGADCFEFVNVVVGAVVLEDEPEPQPPTPTAKARERAATVLRAR